MSRERGLRYAPGLDGVRALAVFAVVSYHLGTTGGVTLLPGGFLGVDLFFVLSGYLITSLLIVEARGTGKISIKQFYIRRARRLLPALFALLLAVAAVGAFWLPQQAARLRGDLLASLGYVMNWWLIVQNSSYFATVGDRPPMLTHLWSLAVEEQYYLVWPLVLILFAAIRAPRGVMLLMVGLGIAGSVVAGYLLYDPYSDPSRVYYGTDTRALAPLLGAFLAIAVQPWRHRRRLPRWAGFGLNLLGVGALLGLTVIAAGLTDTDERLYRGGFGVIALLGAVVVGVAGHPATALGEALATQPLRYLGERSYAIYLWHWPVCLLTRPGLDVPLTGWANAGLRIGVTLVLAELSYQLIEKPIRRNGFLTPLRRRRPEPSTVESPAPVRASARAPSTVVAPTGTYAMVPRSSAPAVYTATSHGRGTRATGAIARTVVLTLVMVGGGTFVGLRLDAAAAVPVGGGPRDLGADVALGPLASTSPTAPAPAPPRPIPLGATVAFFGDSQGMTLLLNRPPDLGSYIDAVDATIDGCGILLGKVESRTGERRNLTLNCSNWRSVWADRVDRQEPALAVVMLGAWDVFDVTLDSGQTLDFASPAWDQNFTAALGQAIDTLRSPRTDVALALLPCYRPIEASAGFWPERGDDDRTRHVNALMTAKARTYPIGVRTLDPPAAFCTDPTIGEDTAYRWDGVHYYKKGAALYFATMLPQILPSKVDSQPTPVAGAAAASTARSTAALSEATLQSPTR